MLQLVLQQIQHGGSEFTVLQLTAMLQCYDPYFSNYINFFSPMSIITKVATNKNKLGQKYSDIGNILHMVTIMVMDITKLRVSYVCHFLKMPDCIFYVRI